VYLQDASGVYLQDASGVYLQDASGVYLQDASGVYLQDRAGQLAIHSMVQACLSYGKHDGQCAVIKHEAGGTSAEACCVTIHAPQAVKVTKAWARAAVCTASTLDSTHARGCW
jgi:hypothetical protein